MKAPLPENEAHRLKTLQDLEVLDTDNEPEFDELTEMAAKICNMPVALISLVDSNRQWFKAKVGLNVDETEREVAFCAHSILSPSEIMEVPNALLDPRFVDNTLVTDGPMFRFYAGVPLIASNGDALGTLCVLDYKPGKLSDFQKLSLKTLSRLVVRELDLRHSYKTMRRVLGEVSDEKNILQPDSTIDEQAIFLQKQLSSRVQFEILSRRILDSTLDAVITTDEHGMVIYWNPKAEDLFGYTEFQAQSKSIIDLIVDSSESEAAKKRFSQIVSGNGGEFTPNRFEFEAIRVSGERVSVEVSVVYLKRFGETVVTSFMRDVTESLVIRDIDAAVGIMRKLKRLGIRFSLDDFGTGYSSLAYLSKLPLSELKIDQSFVRNMHINARPTIIIKTIINMAKSLGLKVVAEGVETQIQYQLLQSFGCQLFQGYHFGRPMPAADCEDFLS